VCINDGIQGAERSFVPVLVAVYVSVGVDMFHYAPEIIQTALVDTWLPGVAGRLP